MELNYSIYFPAGMELNDVAKWLSRYLACEAFIDGNSVVIGFPVYDCGFTATPIYIAGDTMFLNFNSLFVACKMMLSTLYVYHAESLN